MSLHLADWFVVALDRDVKVHARLYDDDQKQRYFATRLRDRVDSGSETSQDEGTNNLADEFLDDLTKSLESKYCSRDYDSTPSPFQYLHEGNNRRSDDQIADPATDTDSRRGTDRTSRRRSGRSRSPARDRK